jgi:hypothetical protein
MATRRNLLLPESIAALVWDFLHETDPESVERKVSLQVGAQLGIVTPDTPRQALLLLVTGNNFIRAVFTRLTSLISLPRLQQHLFNYFYAIRVAIVP